MATVNITASTDADCLQVFTCNAGGVPIDLTGNRLHMGIRYQVADATAALELTTENGGLSLTNAVNGTFTLLITNAQLLNLGAADFVQSLVRIRPDNLQLRVWSGALTVTPGASRSSTAIGAAIASRGIAFSHSDAIGISSSSTISTAQGNAAGSGAASGFTGLQTSYGTATGSGAATAVGVVGGVASGTGAAAGVGVASGSGRVASLGAAAGVGIASGSVRVASIGAASGSGAVSARALARSLPFVDTFASSHVSSATSLDIGPISTTQLRSKVFVCVEVNLSGAPGSSVDIQSITGGGLSFTQRAASPTINTTQNLQEWVADVGNALLTNVTLTITCGASAGFISASAFAISASDGSGVAFDTGGPLTSATSSPAITTTGIAMVIGIDRSSVDTPTTGSGWTGVTSGVPGSWLVSEYQSQTSAGTFTPTYSDVGNGFVTDAIYALGAAPPKGIAAGYGTAVSSSGTGTLLWSDEFDTYPSVVSNASGGASDTTSNWRYDAVWQDADKGYRDFAGTSWNINPNDPAYAGYNPFSVSGSILTISVVRTPSTLTSQIRADLDSQGNTSMAVPAWCGGFLVSNSAKRKILYGYIEWKARWSNPGKGMFPALWLYSSDGSSDAQSKGQAEIDVLELFGQGNLWHTTLHMIATNGTGTSDELAGSPQSTDTTGWHTYGIDWQPGYIKIYKDGALIYTVSSSEAAWYNNVNMNILINFAMDAPWFGSGLLSDGTTPSPMTMDIDYVRVYNAKP